ncbi:MAG: hypothetical protein AAFX93_14070 [Verrucomicrobiota bacterium]
METRHPDFATLSARAQLLWFHIILNGDDNQAMDADPQLVRSTCFPYGQSRIRLTDITRWLEELRAAGYVRLYRSAGMQYVKALRNAQKLKHGKVALVPEEPSEPKQISLDVGNGPREPEDDPPPSEVKRREGKSSCLRTPTREQARAWFNEKGYDQAEADSYYDYNNEFFGWKAKDWRFTAKKWITSPKCQKPQQRAEPQAIPTEPDGWQWALDELYARDWDEGWQALAQKHPQIAAELIEKINKGN